MHKGFFAPSPDAGIKDKAHHSRSLSSGDFTRSPRRLKSMSVLASVRFPSLRRSEPGNTPTTPHKPPLLTLNLSSHSFLDTTLKDDSALSPLYTIKTVGMTTTIVRADPWDASIRTADIKWPKIIPAKSKGKNAPDGVLVQLKGSRWKGGDSFLKPSSSKDGPRKFNIPHYSPSMKWQKHGISYWCTSSPVKGPIAVFDPPVDHLAGRLSIYETFHDKYETSPMLVHKGVSIFLLDYLLVTAILLVTDLQEWMLVQSSSPSMSPNSDQQPNSSLQWRKIAHGEPLFPKLSSATTECSTTDESDSNPAPSSSQAQTARTFSLHPRFETGLKSVLSFSSHSDEGDGDGFYSETAHTRSPSPLAESFFNPLSDDVFAPSHTFSDPSFYSDQEVPPVPPLPSLYSGQTGSISSASTRSGPVRGLSARSPPPVSLETPSFRTSPRSPLSLNQFHRGETFSRGRAVGPADASLSRRRPSEPVISRARSVSRPLPRTPTTPSADTPTPIIRRVQSHNRIDRVDVEMPWLSTSPPPLPPIPPPSVTSRTPRTGRSLPPTPFDLAMGRSAGGTNVTVVSDLRLPPKSIDSGEDNPGWDQFLREEQEASDAVLARPSFDQPPPAYSSIDFHTSNSRPWTRGT